MSTYRNNLVKGDRVMDMRDTRLATVVAQPREDSVNVMLTYQGHSELTKVYVHISRLRLVVDGKPEAVPPVDGEIPIMEARETRKAERAPSDADAVSTLRAELTKNLAEIEGMNNRCREIRARNDKIEAAIKVLS